jgi:hypothetical protein
VLFVHGKPTGKSPFGHKRIITICGTSVPSKADRSLAAKGGLNIRLGLKTLSPKGDRLRFRLKVGSRLKPPEVAPAESRLKARWAL